LLQDYYDVQTDQPVGDLPREADLLLLRRTSAAPPPFRGLWRHLTTWNILEFKGPTVDARLRDLSMLVELGLGIDRRLNQERQRRRLRALEPEEASFWYVVRSLSEKFLATARHRLGQIEEIEPGLWRSQVLQHLLFLISSEKFASEPESVPLHLLFKRSQAQERELAHLVLEQPHYLEWYGRWLGSLHSEVWTEVREMARTKARELKFDLDFIAENVDVKDLAERLGMQRIYEIFGPKKVSDWLIANLPPEELKKLKARLK